MIKSFKVLAKIIFIIGIIGLGLQGVRAITGIALVNNLLPLEEAITIVGKIAIFLSGANVMLEVIKKLFKNQIEKLENVMNFQ